MSEDINAYEKFDFEKEVTALRQELGALADRIVFAQVEFAPLTKDPVRILHLIGDESRKIWARGRIQKAYQKDETLTSFEGPLLPLFDVGELVSLVKYERFTEMFGEDNMNLMRLLTLYHETAHALILEGPQVDETHPFRETAADAYAALRLLQRFGQEAVPLLSMWSWFRSYNAIAGDTAHLSTTVIDRIIADSAGHNFSGLSAEKTIEYATAYARAATPSSRMLKQLKKTFQGVSNEIFNPAGAPYILDLSLRGKSQLASYIGAKYFEPFLHPGGIRFNYKNTDIGAAAQGKYRALIENRTDITQVPQVARLLGFKPLRTRLRRLFTKKARNAPKASVSGFLPVSVPAGQKRFLYERW